MQYPLLLWVPPKECLLFIEGANNKASSDPSKLAGDTHSQALVADAHAELDAIETIMFRNYDVMTDRWKSGWYPDD